MIFLLGLIVGGIVGAMIGFISVAIVLPDECPNCGSVVTYAPRR